VSVGVKPACFGLIDRRIVGTWIVGQMAYLWGWPLVNWHNRRATFAKAPVLGFSGGVLPIAAVDLNLMVAD